MRHRKKKHCPLGGRNACAWCRLHRVTVTPRQMVNRKCLQKQCRHFKPRLDHPIWKQKERSKELRAAKKEKSYENH